jgi:hypothetical protein
LWSEDHVEHSPHENATSASAALGRRQFMRKAAVAGAIVWTVPTINSIEPAGAADRHSEPPSGLVKPAPEVAPAHEVSPAHESDGQLPFTGDNEIVEFGVGVTAITAGAAMLLMSNDDARTVLDSEDS